MTPLSPEAEGPRYDLAGRVEARSFTSDNTAVKWTCDADGNWSLVSRQLWRDETGWHDAIPSPSTDLARKTK